MRRKVCAVVPREWFGTTFLAFEHPLAGRQLVKGTIEAGETPEMAARRELFEESGLRGTVAGSLGTARIDGGEWHFILFEAINQLDDGLIGGETWVHRTRDGGGLDFAFFWHPIDEKPDENWHPIFHEALAFIRSRLGTDPRHLVRK